VAFQVPLIGVAVIALLYLRGGRGLVGRNERAERRWRTPLFLTGLATILLALLPPIDTLSDSLFSIHMLQHMLLLEVAAPLIVLGRPWNRLWRTLPLARRRRVANGVTRAAWAAPLRLLARPAVAFLLMNGSFVLWHLPVLYDAALAHPVLHDLEHATFFLSALLLWTHLLGGGPFRVRLTAPARAAYAVGSMIVGWGLAVVLATAPSPLYTHYAEIGSRPFGLSALADQQLAAGIMWVPASVPWAAVAMICVYSWLNPGGRRHGWVRRLAGEH